MTPLPPRPAPEPPSAAPEPPSLGERLRATATRSRAWLRRWGALTAVLVLLAALAGTALVRQVRQPAPLTARDVATAAASIASQAVEAAGRAPSDASAAYRIIGPSLVVIRTESAGSPTATPAPTDAGGGSEHGLGAGVVINAQGAILTANHVVAGARSITVTFADGTESAARVDKAQPEQDIAVLVAQTLPQVVAPATLGGGVRVGDTVFAVGHPLGLVDSLSAGVVSATGRTISVPGGGKLADLIQFDAAVNPGNSGGPLLDRDGRVVGIVTALANPSDQPFFVGIGFAVPIATAGGAAGGPPI